MQYTLVHHSAPMESFHPLLESVCPYALAYLQSPESVFGVSLTCTYKTYILNRHMNENGSSFSHVLVCHYFCLFWKYHIALFFPLGPPLGSPFLSSGLGPLSPLSFPKSYTNRGKRLLHVSTGHTGHLGLVLAPDFFFLIQEVERERQLFLREGCPAAAGLFSGDEAWLWKAGLGKQQQEMRRGINLSDSFSFLFHRGVVFVFFPLLLGGSQISLWPVWSP